jgi:ribosomal protein S8
MVMNFRVSIKQILARIQVAEKNKDLKVVITFKKEVIPFLVALRRSGSLCKFIKTKKTIILCLKKQKTNLQLKQKQKFVRDFYITAVLYRNPAALIFLSTTFGVSTKAGFREKGQTRIGGKQLYSIH